MNLELSKENRVVQQAGKLAQKHLLVEKKKDTVRVEQKKVNKRVALFEKVLKFVHSGTNGGTTRHFRKKNFFAQNFFGHELENFETKFF